MAIPAGQPERMACRRVTAVVIWAAWAPAVRPALRDRMADAIRTGEDAETGPLLLS